MAGIDISSGMLAVSQRKLAERSPLPRAPIDLRLGDARSLPFADNTFDAAYTSFTLELFPEGTSRWCWPRPGGSSSQGRIGIVSMATVRPGHRVSGLEDPHLDAPPLPAPGRLPPIDTEGLVSAAGVGGRVDARTWRSGRCRCAW